MSSAAGAPPTPVDAGTCEGGVPVPDGEGRPDPRLSPSTCPHGYEAVPESLVHHPIEVEAVDPE